MIYMEKERERGGGRGSIGRGLDEEHCVRI
jgi:hypothetical protein